MGGMAAQAQCGAENTAIKPGETLSYRLKFNWKFIWVNVGWAKMTVNAEVQLEVYLGKCRLGQNDGEHHDL